MLVSLFECLKSDCDLIKELILSHSPKSEETSKCVEMLRTESIFQALTRLENLFSGHDGTGHIYSRLKSVPYLQQVDSNEKSAVLNEGTAFLEVEKAEPVCEPDPCGTKYLHGDHESVFPSQTSCLELHDYCSKDVDGEVKTQQISDHTSSDTDVVETNDALPNSEDTDVVESNDALPNSEDTDVVESRDALPNSEELKKSKRKSSDQFSLDTDEELLKKYMISHPKQRLKAECSECGYTCTDKYMLRRHIYRKHLQKPIVTCPICQKGFYENAAYKHHVENVCGNFNEQKASRKTEENLSSDSNSTNNHQENNAVSCDQNNTIGDKQELQSDVSNSKLPSKNPESAPETLSDDAFKSKFCELHPTKKDKYGCTECHKSFNTLYNLKRHVYSVHLKQPLYNCQSCGKGFYERSKYAKHFSTGCCEPTEDIPMPRTKSNFLCSYCGKNFDRKAKLSYHIHAKHKNATSGRDPETKLKCDSCEKTFKSKTLLQKHVRLRHTQEGIDLLSSLKSGTEYAVCSSKEEAHEKCVQGIRLSLQDIKSWFSTEINEEGQVIYQCTECAEYRSPFPVKLRRHLERVHFALKHFECFMCNSKFLERWEIAKHMRSVHNLPNSSSEAEETVADKQQSSDTENESNNANTNENGLTDNDIVEKYCRKVKIIGQVVWECTICGKKYLHQNAKLKEHVKVVHLEVTPASQATKARLESEEAQKSLKLPKEEDKKLMEEYGIYYGDGRKLRFECKVCGYKQGQFTRFRSHIYARHLNKIRFLCSFCSKGFANKESLRSHEVVHQPSDSRKKFDCSACGKTFMSSAALKVHSRIHTGERPHKCAYCTKAFIQKKSRIDHENRVHLNNRNIVCSVCSYRCTTSSDLIVHNRVHTGEKPYKCAHCHMQFRTTSQLHDHNRRHTGSFRQQCSICMKNFMKNVHYRQHMFKHHQLSVITDHRYNKATNSENVPMEVPGLVTAFLQ